MKTTLILGAGFSKNSGLPIQSEIPALLTKYKENSNFERSVLFLGYIHQFRTSSGDKLFSCSP